METHVQGIRHELDPPRLDSPILTFFKSYWDSKRGDRRMPSRADIRPVEMKEHLGWVILLDVLADYADFRFRTIGTRVTQYVFANATGMTLSECMAPYGEAAVLGTLELYREAAERQLPLHMFGTAEVLNRSFLDVDALLLPLSDNGVATTQIFGAWYLEPTRAVRATT